MYVTRRNAESAIVFVIWFILNMTCKLCSLLVEVKTQKENYKAQGKNKMIILTNEYIVDVYSPSFSCKCVIFKRALRTLDSC